MAVGGWESAIVPVFPNFEEVEGAGSAERVSLVSCGGVSTRTLNAVSALFRFDATQKKSQMHCFDI